MSVSFAGVFSAAAPTMPVLLYEQVITLPNTSYKNSLRLVLHSMEGIKEESHEGSPSLQFDELVISAQPRRMSLCLSHTHHVGELSHGDQNRSSPLNAPFETGIAHMYPSGLFPPPERKCLVPQLMSKLIHSLTYLHGKKVLTAFSYKGF